MPGILCAIRTEVEVPPLGYSVVDLRQALDHTSAFQHVQRR